MALIRCTQSLWRALGQPGRPPVDGDEALIAGASLGPWAARLFKGDRHDLVLAVNERTCLTVVFPLVPRDAFRVSFGNAVTSALQDLGVPERHGFIESSAVEVGSLVRLTNRSIKETLNNLEFYCGIELEYHTDLRTVQLNLNAVPHPRREPCVPADAVIELFGREEGRDPVSPH